MLEVVVPPDALVHFLEEANDFSNVRVVILGWLTTPGTVAIPLVGV